MRACFMLARVGKPSSLVRERERKGDREREREGDRERVRGRERKRERERERERKTESERERYRIWVLNLKETTGALASFSYPVSKS